MVQAGGQILTCSINKTHTCQEQGCHLNCCQRKQGVQAAFPNPGVPARYRPVRFTHMQLSQAHSAGLAWQPGQTSGLEPLGESNQSVNTPTAACWGPGVMSDINLLSSPNTEAKGGTTECLT